MGVPSVSFLLAFGCSIHCVLFSVLSMVFPLISIQHSDLIHRFDLMFIVVSVLTTTFIFVRFVYLPKMPIKLLPLISSMMGSALLLASLHRILSAEFFFQTLGSLLLAISNLYYIQSYQHQNKCPMNLFHKFK